MKSRAPRVLLFPSNPPGTRADSGSTTIRLVLASVVVDISDHLWKILTAVGVVSDPTFTYWDERIFLPLSEGLMVLPTAIVISVWMDVANSSMSRSKVFVLRT